MNGPQGRSLVTSDHDEALAHCRDFLKRIGPEACRGFRRRFEEAQKSGDDDAVIVGSFALLGLLAAELSIEPDEPEE